MRRTGAPATSIRATGESFSLREAGPLKVLVIDVGGSHIKLRATGHSHRRKFTSGPHMTAKAMVAGVAKAAEGWTYDAVTIGYPGVVRKGEIVEEPHHLAGSWVGFDFHSAFACPVHLINDAAMQALGSYRGGKLLFLGLGTGLGSAMVVNGMVVPMELGHLPFKKGEYEDYVGKHALKRHGKKKWRKHVKRVATSFVKAFEPTDVVIGGGNVRKLKHMPCNARAGDNANAFLGGFRLWAQAGAHPDGSA